MNLRAILPAIFLACLALPAFAETPKPATAACPAALAGEYRLDGVMETGSGLLLRADCGFEWYFSYGALDLGARGRWEPGANGITLVVEDMGFPPQMPETKFERMSLRSDEGALVPSWPWDMDAFRAGAELGRYERVEP
ncbi:MAG: hypothetical protein QM719_04885 [Thermomonas sp.]